ncbi:MAG: ATP-binding cassette domain-containing protein [Anaeroplasmataceae bacterium]
MITLKIVDLNKSFSDRKIIENFSLDVPEGKFVCIRGRSGSGKSTLLNMIGGLINPDSGEIYFNNKRIELINTRSGRNTLKDVQYLFQKTLVIENKTVRYNLNITRKNIFKPYRDDELVKVLEAVNLNIKLNQKCHELSGGEQQRLVIARLLLSTPKLIICDEPAGSLDSENARRVYSLLKAMTEKNITIICVSHDEYILEYVDSVISLEDL